MKQTVKLFDKLTLKELDTNEFEAQLLVDGSPFDLTSYNVQLVVSDDDKTVLKKDVEIVDAVNGMVKFKVNDKIGNGLFEAELVVKHIEYSTKHIFPNHDYLAIRIVPSLLENRPEFVKLEVYNDMVAKRDVLQTEVDDLTAVQSDIEAKLEEINGEDSGTVDDDLMRTSDIKTYLYHTLHAKGLEIDENTPFRDYPDIVTSIQSPVDMAKLLLDGDATEIEIPEGVTKIKSYAFYQQNAITTVILPSTLISIGNYAFCDGNMTEIHIPNSVKTLGNNVFKYCSYLKEVSIGNGVTKIEYCTFDSCTRLQKVTLGNGIKSIYLAGVASMKPFYKCTALTEIHIDLPSTQTYFTIPTDHWGATNSTIYWNDGKVTLPNTTTPVEV